MTRFPSDGDRFAAMVSAFRQFRFVLLLWRNALAFELRLAWWRGRRRLRQLIWRAAWSRRLWQFVAGLEAGLLIGGGLWW